MSTALWESEGSLAWRRARGRRWERYVSVVPLAHERTAAAMGSAVGARWEAERRASRRRAKLSRGIWGTAESEVGGVGAEGGAGEGGFE